MSRDVTPGAAYLDSMPQMLLGLVGNMQSLPHSVAPSQRPLAPHEGFSAYLGRLLWPDQFGRHVGVVLLLLLAVRLPGLDP